MQSVVMSSWSHFRLALQWPDWTGCRTHARLSLQPDWSIIAGKKKPHPRKSEAPRTRLKCGSVIGHVKGGRCPPVATDALAVALVAYHPRQWPGRVPIVSG